MAMTRTAQTAKDVYELDAALKAAMKKHSDLLGMCTALQMRADEMIVRAKHSRFRASVDFEDYMEKMMAADSVSALEDFVKPLFLMNLKKTFYTGQLDDLLSYKPEENIATEVDDGGRETAYIYDDEAAEARIQHNFDYFLKVLFEQISDKGRVALSYLNHLYEMKFGSEIYFNGDYYAFLTHLSQKTAYDLSTVDTVQDTFLEGIMAQFLKTENGQPFRNLKFSLSYRADIKIELPNTFDMTEIVFERTDG